MDSKRVLIAIQEKLRWEGRKARIEERLARIRERKGLVLHQIEEVKNRIAQLTTLGATTEGERPAADSAVRIGNLR